MQSLKDLVRSFLQSNSYNLLNVGEREGFVLANKLTLGNVRDTRLVWVTPPSSQVHNFDQLERRLIQEFEELIPQYPDADYSLVTPSREGFSQSFHSERRRFGVVMQVPIDYFDTPFKLEETPGEFRSTITSLRDPAIHQRRVPQPYRVIVAGEARESGADLLPQLFKELRRPQSPCLRIVVGPAGAGKSVLFHALFSQLYREFSDHKKRNEVFARPFPFIPEYLKGRRAGLLRLEQLINEFVKKELAAHVERTTIDWSLINGYATWLFDGLDELYTADEGFFFDILELMTQKDSVAQILICARGSLLTSCETLIEFLDQFSQGSEDVRVYQLENWEMPSKRAYAWTRFGGRLPSKKPETDPPKVFQFLSYLKQSETLQSLSGIPFYCRLLADEFAQDGSPTVSDDITLIEHVVSKMIEREVDKGLLPLEQFMPNGLNDWLETVAWEFYGKGSAGLRKPDIEEYAEVVLRPELSPEERSHIITSFLQNPLFARGSESGLLTFEHELIAEYLTGRYVLNSIETYTKLIATSLGVRNDLADSFILRYIASKLTRQPEKLQAVIDTLRANELPDHGFANLLQLFLLAAPTRDAVRANRISTEGKSLKYLQFRDQDLREVSFRNCDLSGTSFKACGLQNAHFEGAILVGTKFEQLSSDALQGTGFGNLERFEFIYVGKQRIEDPKKMIEWMQRATGVTRQIKEPCPAALQLRTLFLKFVYPDGNGRRDELLAKALPRGKRYADAPSPEDCIKVCLTAGYLQGPDWRDRIRRIPGEAFNHIVYFVRDWKLTPEMHRVLDSLCRNNRCEHIPGKL